MRILVTGGAGFIGSNFVRRVLDRHRGWRLTVLDKLTYAGNLANLRDVLRDPRLRFVRGDVCVAAHVRDAIRSCDAVVHFAAETHVDRSILDSGSFVRTDVEGTRVVLEAARVAKVSRMLHISTDEVYGDAPGRPSREGDELRPRSPYAASKAGADRLAFSYFATFGLPVVVTRCGNNYGPYQHPEKLIPLFATNAIEGRPLPLYGDGRNRRDWIHVEDHCAALETLLSARGVDGQAFNIGARTEVANRTIAERICGWTGVPKERIRRVADRPGHVRRHAVDPSKLRRAIGWRPQVRFDEGLRDTVVWYVRNRAWWAPLKRTRAFRAYTKAVYDRAWRGGARASR